MNATRKSRMALYSLRGQTAVGALALLLIFIFCALMLPGRPPAVPGEAEKTLVQEAYGRLPLYFVKNEGQFGNMVKYYEKGAGHAIFFTDEEIVFHLETGADSQPAGNEDDARVNSREIKKTAHSATPARSSQVRFSPVGMQKDVSIEGLELQEGKVNYFIGKDPDKWRTNVHTYRSIVYQKVYPGIDLKFYGSNERLEYDVIVNPGADPSQVKFCYSGIQNLRVTEAGDLHLQLPNDGTLIQKKPLAYQEIHGERHEVEGQFVVEPRLQQASGDVEEPFVFGFQMASYNANYPLIIDPVLIYSTYLGSSGSDNGYAIAVDTSGYAYVTGRTTSTAFPASSAYDSSYGGGGDVFVTKLNTAGTALIYSTYLGGSSLDAAYAIALDSSGCAYVTGETSSTDFPTVSAFSYALASAGMSDAFVAKLSANGSSLIYSTYLGGNSIDIGRGIAVDSSGVAYVTGETSSSTFPIDGSPLQSTFAGGYSDAFVTVVNAYGNDLTYSTYLGGNDADAGYGIAVNGSNVFVVGETSSANFPTSGGYQNIYDGGGSDAFVVKFVLGTMTRFYSTYLGGSGPDFGLGIAADTSGCAYVTGSTSSTDFPTTTSAAQPSPGGGDDAFVTKLAADGNSLVFSTYLGGAEDDVGFSIAADTKGNAYVAGKTGGSFPVTKAIQSTYGGGGSDAFVARITSTGNEVAYSTYLGGAAVDVGRGIAAGTGGNVYVTGYSSSYDFPVTSSAFMKDYAGGGNDVFVSKLSALLADFYATPTTGLYPLTVAFTDTSEGTISSWLWNFGDGSSSTTQNPSHSYASAGTYTVSLKVTGTGGEDTKSRSGYIKVAVPEVTISATTPSVLESGGGSGQFTVYRSAYTTFPLTVNYTVGGTATSGTDYTALSGSLTIPAGASSAPISVTPVWDKINDGDETVVVTLTSSTLYSIGSPSSATVTIVDNDLPTVTVSASVASVTEKSPQDGLIVLTRAGVTTTSLTVYYTVGGTALSNTDYTPLPTSITIPAGSSSVNIAVKPLWDQVYDGDKTVVVTLFANSLYTVASPSSATVTIVDSDLPTVTITATSSSISEGASLTGQYVVTHTGTTSLPLTVIYAIGGTGVNGTHFAALSGSVTIPVGSSTAPITLTPIRDYVFSGDHTVILSLTVNSLYLIGTPNTATITITESDLPTVTVTATQPNASEPSVTGKFTVSRTGITTNALTVAYAVGGTAKPGTNYSALPGTISIPPGAASAEVIVQPLDDSLWTGPTTVILSLGANALYNIGAANSATVTIADNDGPSVTITATRATVSESDTGKGQFTVTRSAHNEAALTVYYTVGGSATKGVDYIALQGSMTIPAGSAAGSILVSPLEDFVSDGDKTVVVTLTGSDLYKLGSPSSATVSILDSDLPTVTITPLASSVLEQGSQTAQFTVSRTGLLTSALVVKYTTGGTAISGFDYTAPSGTLTIPAGSSSATIAVTPLWDQVNDGDKTLILTLASSSNYNVGSPSNAAATIVDQDRTTVTIVASVPSISEQGSQPGVFQISRTGPTTSSLTVNFTVSGTAQAGVNYVDFAKYVVIPAGSSAATVQVYPIDDKVSSDGETVIATLASSALYNVGTSGSATVTIYESGPATVTIVATNPFATEGGTAGQFTVYRTKMTTESLTVGYSIGGTAVAGVNYTGLATSVTLPVGQASATINVQPMDNTVWTGPTTVVLTLSDSALYNLGAATTATVTVSDNDGPTVYMQEFKTHMVAREAGQVAAQVKVWRTTVTGALEVAYSFDGNATNGVDFETLSGTVTIPDGSDHAYINIIPIDDDIYEGREVLLFSLVPYGSYKKGWPSTGDIVIVDNDLPKVTVTAIDDNASESSPNPGTFRVARKGLTTSSLPVYYTVGGTATNGLRYQQLNGSVELAVGAAYVDIPVIPYDDSVYEGNETVTLTLSGTSIYTVGTPDSATITIRENDLPVVSVTAPVGAVDENGTEAGVFRVSRSGLSDQAPALEVNYSISGTAVPGTDFQATFSGTITIPTGASSADFTLLPVNNDILDGTRTVIFTLSSASGYTLGTSVSAVVSILDDEMPVATVKASDPLASENATDTGTFTIFRTGDLSLPLDLTYTVGGTATPNIDYTALDGNVTIPAGASSVNVVVSALENQTAQLDKTVILSVSSGPTHYVGSPNQATVAIFDDDTPVVSVNAVRNASESGTKGQFRISRVGSLQKSLLVNYKVGGTAVKNVNYVPLSGKITIPAGQVSKILEVTPKDDNQTTGDLTVVVSLSQASSYLTGSSNSAFISISDNDMPAVTVVATDPYAIEKGLHSGIFTITRSKVASSPLTVKYGVGGTAKAGTDYKALSGTVTIAKGAASAVVNVIPIDDNKTDLNRTVELTLKTNTAYFLGKPSAATLYISDKGLPEVSLTVPDKFAAKPSDNGAFKIWRIGPTTAPLTVKYAVGGTATNGTDYVKLTGTATIPANASFVNVTVTPRAAGVVTNSETVILTLASDSNYTLGSPNKGTVIILGDSLPAVSVTAKNPNASETGLKAGTFTITRTGSTASAYTIDYKLSGTATNGKDYVHIDGTVDIPMGASSVDITVMPKKDAITEGSETVILTITPTLRYKMGSTTSATVAISD